MMLKKYTDEFKPSVIQDYYNNFICVRAIVHKQKEPSLLLIEIRKEITTKVGKQPGDIIKVTIQERDTGK